MADFERDRLADAAPNAFVASAVMILAIVLAFFIVIYL
jgi:hypothetical protein